LCFSVFYFATTASVSISHTVVKVITVIVISVGIVPGYRDEPILASQRDAMKIARHFSAGNNVDDDHSPGRTAEIEALEVSVVPAGLSKTRAFLPALKCWAIIVLPLPGRGQQEQRVTVIAQESRVVDDSIT
jgi:hypothetical protein